MDKKEKVIQYLQKYGKYLNLSEIEREIGIKQPTLRPFLKSNKYNIDKHIEALHKLFIRMRYLE